MMFCGIARNRTREAEERRTPAGLRSLAHLPRAFGEGCRRLLGHFE